MKVCIPTRDSLGMRATVDDHFGSAPFYTVVDTESGNVQVSPNTESGHGHHPGHGQGDSSSLRSLRIHVLDAVACREIGRRALSSLERDHVEVFRTDRKTVSEVVQEVQSGSLRPLRAGEGCPGERHRGRRGGCDH